MDIPGSPANNNKLFICVAMATFAALAAPRPAFSLPFRNNNIDFENFVNQVWRGGGANGVNIGPTMRSSDPARETRKYWGFHNCIWKTNDSAINGNGDVYESIGGGAYEVYQCTGYLDYTTPMRSERCKGRFSYEWRSKNGVWGKYIEQDLIRTFGICTD